MVAGGRLDVPQFQSWWRLPYLASAFPDGAPEQITWGPTEEEGIAMAPDGRSFIAAVGVVHSARLGARWPRRPPDLARRLRIPNLLLMERGCATSSVQPLRGSCESRNWIPDAVDPCCPGSPHPVRLPTTFLRMAWRVVASADQAGKPHLWLAPLDRSSAPRQIPNADGVEPLFGAGREIFFRKVEGTSGSLYSIREDGTGLRKAADEAIADVEGSPRTINGSQCNLNARRARPHAGFPARWESTDSNCCFPSPVVAGREVLVLGTGKRGSDARDTAGAGPGVA
jgi:hypothetical protein